MTDGPKKPNKVADEDWAMSEHDSPVKKDGQKLPVDENVAKLYDPVETGDLSGWDISPQDMSIPSLELPPLREFQATESDLIEFLPAAEPQAPSYEINDTPDVPPLHSFEVVEPVPQSNNSSDDWGMAAGNPPNADGWIMPEPIFRKSEGRLYTKSTSRSADDFLEQTLTDGYSAKYAADDASAADKPVAEDFVVPEVPEVYSENPQESGHLVESDHPVESEDHPAQQAKPELPVKNKGRTTKWVLIVLLLFFFGFLAVLTAIAALFYFEVLPNTQMFW